MPAVFFQRCASSVAGTFSSVFCAIGTDQNKKFVFVVGDDAKAAWREVSLGAAHDGLRVVTAGLKLGERIVVNGLQRVRPGATVAPEPVPMAEKSELRKPATELAQR